MGLFFSSIFEFAALNIKTFEVHFRVTDAGSHVKMIYFK